MKIELFVTNVIAVGSPDRAERATLGVILAGRLFGQFRPIFVVGESLCDVRITSRALIPLLRAI